MGATTGRGTHATGGGFTTTGRLLGRLARVPTAVALGLVDLAQVIGGRCVIVRVGAVNNLDPAPIGNVYNEPVIVNNVTVNRVSFNGGEGGVAARPTPAQVLADKEPHIPPTGPQKDHARIASMNGGQFMSANKGRPVVAATPRPGELKGKGVLPAKAAGTAQQTVPAAGGNAPQVNGKRAPLTGEGQRTNPAAAPSIKTEPFNPAAAKQEEKLPVGGKPIKSEALNPAAAKAQEKPPAAERATAPKPSAEKAAVPVSPQIEEKLHRVEKPATSLRPPVAEKTAAPPPPGPAAPNLAARPLAPKPQAKPAPKECGLPGQPKCP